MNKMMAKKNNLVMLVAATLVVVILFCFLLVACNKNEDNSDREYGLYVSRIEYDDDTLTMTAFVYLTNDETKKLDGVNAVWRFESQRLNAFYNLYEYHINFDPSSIFSAVDASLTQEQRKKDDLEFVVLKVTFEYATIYKSMSGSEIVTKSGRYYLHDYPLNEAESSFDTTLSIKSQNAAGWYGVLTAVAVAVFGAIVLAVFIRRKQYATKERTED